MSAQSCSDLPPVFKLVDWDGVWVLWCDNVLDHFEGLGPAARQNNCSLLVCIGNTICCEIQLLSLNVTLPVLFVDVKGMKHTVNCHDPRRHLCSILTTVLEYITFTTLILYIESCPKHCLFHCDGYYASWLWCSNLSLLQLLQWNSFKFNGNIICRKFSCLFLLGKVTQLDIIIHNNCHHTLNYVHYEVQRILGCKFLKNSTQIFSPP